MEAHDAAESRLHGWAIVVSVVLIAFPCLFALTAAFQGLSAVRSITSGPYVSGLVGRSLLLLLLGTLVYFLLAASASYGFRIGKVERWVVWSHWLVVAAVFQGEAWRLMAWTFFRDTAHSFGPVLSLRLSAALGQALPYLLFWGAILHILILEMSAGARTAGDIRDNPFARRRFWHLVWGLWPAAMTGFLALDLLPGVWRAHPAYADVGPLGVWLLGVEPFGPMVGHGTRLALAVANGAAEVWVLAALAVLLIFLRSVSVRHFLAGAPSPDSQAPTASTVAAGPERLDPGAPPRVNGPNRIKGDPKPFLVQFVTLNGGLFLLIIAPAYIIITSLFHLGAIPSPVEVQRTFAALGKAFSGTFLFTRFFAPVIAAFAVGAIGWVVSTPLEDDDPASSSPGAGEQTGTEGTHDRAGLSPSTSLLLSMLAFWPLGWHMAAGLAPIPFGVQPTAFLATWVPNGLVLVPLALLTLGPNRRNWWVPMIVAAATVAWIGLDPPVLNGLGGMNYLEDLILSPHRTFVGGLMGWRDTGMAATVLMVVSSVLIGCSWVLAIVLWPRRKK